MGPYPRVSLRVFLVMTGVRRGSGMSGNLPKEQVQLQVLPGSVSLLPLSQLRVHRKECSLSSQGLKSLGCCQPGACCLLPAQTSLQG